MLRVVVIGAAMINQLVSDEGKLTCHYSDNQKIVISSQDAKHFLVSVFQMRGFAAFVSYMVVKYLYLLMGQNSHFSQFYRLNGVVFRLT